MSDDPNANGDLDWDVDKKVKNKDIPKSKGNQFKYGIVNADITIEQIELYIKERKQDFWLTINDITIDFDDFKYVKDDYGDMYFYEFYFYKNNERVAYFEAYSDYKFTCHLLNDTLYSFEFEEPKK